MKISFACPSCGANGSADESFVGRQVRCKPCQHRFVIPGADPGDDGGYLLDDPAPKSDHAGPAGGVAFVPSRGEEPTAFVSPRKPRPLRKKKPSREGPEIAWGAWLFRGGIVGAVVLAGVALIAPRGLEIVGLILISLGALLVLIGYGAGAFGAFSEDFLYGFFYLVFPLYTGYYVVTRWDDLRNWFLGSTAGFGLFVLGGVLLRWSGVAE